MRKILLKIIRVIKGLVLVLRPHIIFGFLRHPFFTFSNTLSLSKWISQNKSNAKFNDFYSFKRDHSKRYELYQFVCDELKFNTESVDYLEFGVYTGLSIKWWVSNMSNSESKFYGFDTFEGLPENWGGFGSGEMSADVPTINDTRVKFVKGLFQDTLHSFLENHDLKNGKRKIVHFDADLFTSTLFALTTLAPYLKKGDVLLFDEFNVPNHEYLAFKLFSDSFYVKTKLLGAINNYYQVAIIIE